MKRKIGVMIESFKLGIREGIAKAAELGADGFQVFVTRGELTAENMSGQDRRDFKRYVDESGIEISALCGDMGKGFLDPATKAEVIERTQNFIDLAVDLETTIITTHIGHLPDDENAREWEVGVETARILGTYAEQRGCVLASETGPEPPTLLKRFLERVDSTGVRINYDPANFILAGPFDHIGGVRVLGDYIVHTHAKDGVCLLKGEAGQRNESLEVPLGEGSVAFKYYLQALDEIGYKGYLTIEREHGEDPVSDVANAVKFLRSFE
jgi:sugar phosphate isomerase/epimerase